MAAPVYLSDLTTILADMPSTTGWSAIGTPAALTAPEEDDFVQGSNCISKGAWSTDLKGMIYNAGTQTVTSGKAVYMWLKYDAPKSLATEGGGGMQVIVGSSSSAYKRWFVRGSDTYLYDGWICSAVDTKLSPATTTGSPTSTTSYFGGLAWIPAGGPSKGYPWKIDAFRHGRDFSCYLGDVSNGYATFSGAAAYNDNSARRYGQFQTISGGYLMQGRFVMGSSATVVDFRDSNKNILLARNSNVTTNFNGFEVNNASSRVDWTNISVSPLGTNTKGFFSANANADINMDGCGFTDMNTFTFQSNSEIENSTFRRCGQVIQGGAIFTNCVVTNSTASAAMLCSNPTTVSYCDFISAGSGHALEFTAGGTYAFTGNTFNSYATINGSTGNECIYNNSGATITLQLSEVSGLDASPSIRNGTGAGTVLENTVYLNVTVKDTGGSLVDNARVGVYSSADDYEFMNALTVSGVATSAADYSSDVDVYIRVRKSTGGTRYINNSTTGTIDENGLNVTVTLYKDGVL